MTESAGMTDYTGLLAAEEAFFQENDMKFRVDYPNRVLLIHGDKLVGNFATEAEAVVYGVLNLGEVPFLVRRPGQKAPVLTAPALTLGLLQSHADD